MTDVRSVFERYCEYLTAHDASKIAELYAEDGWIEDPVGSAVIDGREAIHAFYEEALERVKPESVVVTGNVRILADQSAGAATLESRSVRDGQPIRLEIIDVMTFNSDGLITTMRGYWGPENRTISADPRSVS